MRDDNVYYPTTGTWSRALGGPSRDVLIVEDAEPDAAANGKRRPVSVTFPLLFPSSPAISYEWLLPWLRTIYRRILVDSRSANCINSFRTTGVLP